MKVRRRDASGESGAISCAQDLVGVDPFPKLLRYIRTVYRSRENSWKNRIQECFPPPGYDTLAGFSVDLHHRRRYTQTPRRTILLFPSYDFRLVVRWLPTFSFTPQSQYRALTCHRTVPPARALVGQLFLSSLRHLTITRRRRRHCHRRQRHRRHRSCHRWFCGACCHRDFPHSQFPHRDYAIWPGEALQVPRQTRRGGK